MPLSASSMSLFQNPKPSPLPDDGHRKDILQHLSTISNPPLDMPSFRSFGERPIDSAPDNPERPGKSKAYPSMKKRVDSHLVSCNGGARPSDGYVPSSPQHKSTYRRPGGKAMGDGEKPTRKRNRSKQRDKAVNHNLVLSSSHESGTGYRDSPISLHQHGVYEETLGLTQYMKDVSLQGRMSGEFSAQRNVVDNSFGMHHTPLDQDLAPLHTDYLCQPSSTFAFERTMDSESTKFMPELELTARMEEDRVDDKEKTLFLYGSGLSLNKPRESSLIESLPIMPPEELWSMIQLNPTIPLDALISQAVTLKKDMATLGNTIGNLSQLFPVNPTQTSQHYGMKSDNFANCDMNHWIKIGSLQSEQTEIKESNIHVEMDVEVAMGMQKDHIFDIDLNRQPPEADAEAEEFMAFSSKPEIVQLPPVAEITSERSSFDVKASPYKCSEAKYQVIDKGNRLCDTDELMIDKQECLESTVKMNSQEENETQQMQELDVNTAYKSVEDGPSDNLLPLAVHMREGGKEDVPCSPGRQAAADILCEMARSSTLFYNQQSVESGYLNSSGCTKLPPKVIRIVGPIGNEKGVNAHNIAAHRGDQSFNGSIRSVLIPSKAKGTEPYWAPTSSINAAQLSEKESSPVGVRTYQGIKKLRSTSSEMHERNNKVSKTSRVVMSFSSSKEAKGCHQISRKASPHTPSSKSMSPFHERDCRPICESNNM